MTYEIAGRLVWACHSDWSGFFCFLGRKILFSPEETIIPSEGEKIPSVG